MDITKNMLNLALTEGVSLSRSSGHSARDTVHRIRRFPPFPGDLPRSSLTVQVPLAFRLPGG